MKNVVIALLCLVVAVAAFGQTIDLDEIEVSDLDLSQADLSDAEFYFAGPVDLLVRGVEYQGVEYAALLKYDGRGNVEIAAPGSTSAAGLPYAVDLSEVRLSLVSDGIRVGNVIADGRYFAGKLVPAQEAALAVAPQITMGGPAGVAELSDDVEALRSQVSGLRGELAALRSQRDDAEEELADAQSQINSLESRLAQAGRGPENPLSPASNVRRTVRSGFSGGDAVNGSWSRSGRELRQSSTAELYAKYPIPAQQNANELVLAFSGSGIEGGWSGYGVHFLASGSDDPSLYGYGNSYLVWVTRDPAHTQSEQTFVQLYRSYDDVHMVQLASRAIPARMDDPVDVTVYVNRSERSIVLGVDEEPVLTFEDPELIRTGSEIVARTLGPATLTNLSVRSR